MKAEVKPEVQPEVKLDDKPDVKPDKSGKSDDGAGAFGSDVARAPATPAHRDPLSATNPCNTMSKSSCKAIVPIVLAQELMLTCDTL